MHLPIVAAAAWVWRGQRQRGLGWAGLAGLAGRWPRPPLSCLSPTDAGLGCTPPHCTPPQAARRDASPRPLLCSLLIPLTSLRSCGGAACARLSSGSMGGVGRRRTEGEREERSGGGAEGGGSGGRMRVRVIDACSGASWLDGVGSVSDYRRPLSDRWWNGSGVWLLGWLLFGAALHSVTETQ
jgi:hypothetical protein